MDKQFVNIDDLVRQRLGGGEEREQAGSWGRMHDLLDKEMPQRKPAGMYWRRSLSAIALLLLVSSAGIGAYMMTNGHNAQVGAAAPGDLVAAAANTTANRGIAANDAGTVNNTEPTSKKEITSTANNITARTTTDNNTPATENNKTTLAATAKNNDGEAKPNAPVNDAVKQSKHHKISNSVSAATVAPNVATLHKHTDNKNKPVAANETTGNNESSGTHTTADHKALAAKNSKGSAPLAIAKSDATNNTPATDSKETTGAIMPGSSAPSVKNNVTAKAKHGIAAKEAHTKTSNTQHHEATTGIATATPDNADNGVDQPTAGTNNTAKRFASNKPAKQGSHKKGNTTPVTMTGMPLAANTSTGGANKAPSATTIKAMRKGQRMVQRLVLAEHLVRVSATEMRLVVDTISKDNVMEEYDLAIAPVFGPVTYENYLNTVDETSTVAVAKDNHIKKTGKTSTMENLSAAFNDMKTKVNGAHFNAGLTAGINGTFFGPNSFKGFQFGGTGTVTLSENLAIMGELKYFHRINNNYALSDNYYSYTPSATGGYTRVLVNNPYSFSSLHSIELPISVRYCTGNFNFFVGGNFEYSFSINTGAYPLPDQGTATQVATIGNDNTPKIQNNDFNSKFGVGYLVGASCKLSSNMSVDFRSVQNIWDNSSSVGAKYISGQLYRSPSLQLSLSYRLGSNRDKSDK